MSYKCPKGHISTDSDYCSECGTLIGQSNITKIEEKQGSSSENSAGEICPDCGTERTLGARFCEVCRHDFQENKTGVAEAVVASQKVNKEPENIVIQDNSQNASVQTAAKAPTAAIKDVGDFVIAEKLNLLITVDKQKADSCDIETAVKPDNFERTFPLDLDENLVGRRSANKGIYPEIEINDPGVSKRHLKFIKQSDGTFAVLELGSSNGTELNGVTLEAGVITPVKAGDILSLGIWTDLKIITR